MIGSGERRSLLLRSDEIAEVLTPVMSDIAVLAERVLGQVPDPVGVVTKERGLLLTGGMAAVHGLREGLAATCDADVIISEAPTRSVLRGLRAVSHAKDGAGDR